MSVWSLLVVASLRTLVLPFENVSNDPVPDWRGSAFEEAIATHLEAAGHDVVTPTDRNEALIAMGFAPGEAVSRATAILLGAQLGAQRLVIGSFQVELPRIDVEARVIDITRGATVGVIQDYAEDEALASLASQIAKNLFRLEAPRAPDGFAARAEMRSDFSRSALEASARARTLDDRNEQRRLLETAVRYEPDYIAARLFLGRLLLEGGEPRSAIEVLVGAGEELSRHPRSYFDLGMAYLAVDEAEPALRVFESLTPHLAETAIAANNRGVALLALGRTAEAVDAFREATGSRPDDPLYRLNLGVALWCDGQGDRALEELERARALAPYDAELHWLASLASESEGLVDEAARLREAAVVLDPSLASVEPEEASRLARPSGWDPRPVPTTLEALSLEEDAAALEPLFASWALRELGRTDEALRVLREHLYHSPTATALRRELVDALVGAGALDEAARELHMLLWTEPTAESHIDLAKLYREMGEPEKAREQVELALALAPGDPDAERLRAELAPKSQ